MIQITDNTLIRLVGDGEYIMVNSNSYRTPQKLLFGHKHTICIVDDKIYVNGYKLVKGRWKITIGSLFHLFF